MSRILNRQRQMAEQGRLRLGYTVPHGDGKTRPVRSETWVVTSHSEEHIRTAAELWGGDVERWQPLGSGHEQWRVITESHTIDAFLPPGDPLTQAYEQWSKGGCQVRCDGVTEQFSGSPCLCLAKYGEQWYERNTGVCDSKSRLKVLLEDMPGLGVWRMETGSYYATDEIAGMVDTIRAAVGPATIVPVRLRIEQRTRVAGGQTKQFVVPVLDLRGVTAGALLAGNVDMKAITDGKQELGTGKDADAEADPLAAYYTELEAAATSGECMEIYRRAKAAGLLEDEKGMALYHAIGARGKELGSAETKNDEPVDAQASEADDTADADAVWQQIVTVAGERGMTTEQLESDFAARSGGVVPAAASAAELRSYLDTLKERAA